MNTIKNIFKLSNLAKIFLYLLLPVFVILFLVGGCSFKYFNPQYYRFLELCKDVDKKVVVYNEDYWEIIRNIEQIKTNDKGCFYSDKLKQEICFGNFAYSKHNSVEFKYDKFGLREILYREYYNDTHFIDYTSYTYTYYGVWLKGDEGAGWHWENEDFLECSIMDNYYYNSRGIR